MIRLNIIGTGFVDMTEDAKLSFKTQNQQFRFADISLGRSVEFTIPATDRNRNMLGYGEDPSEDGAMLRSVHPCQLVYDGGVKEGTLSVTSYDSDAFKCVFTIGNAEWIEKLQNCKLADVGPDWAGVLWSVSNPVVNADAADPLQGNQLIRYESNGTGHSTWQILPSVNVKQYLIDIFAGLGIPLNMTLDDGYWLIAGSAKGGVQDTVDFTQVSATSFNVTGSQNYFTIADISLEWATMDFFGLIGGGSDAAKAFKAEADVKVKFPTGMPSGLYLIKYNKKLSKCEVVATTTVNSWSQYKQLNGATIDFDKGDAFFIASKPMMDAVTYYGWKTTDIPAVAITVSVERNSDLSLGETWRIRNNQPDMTVFEFLRSVALATGCELQVDGEYGVTLQAGVYGLPYIRSLGDVISTGQVSRNVSAWGSNTRKASIVFDSEDYVTDKIVSSYGIDNVQLGDTKNFVSKFSEGNVGPKGVAVDDADTSATPPKFVGKKWTIAYADGIEPFLQRIPVPDPVGYFDIADNSTCMEVKVAAPEASFFRLIAGRVFVWRGMAYIWTDASWSDGVLTMTLQKVSQPRS